MNFDFRWLASLSTSALHAAWVICQGHPLADHGLAAALAEPATRFAAELTRAGLHNSNFWWHLLPQSAALENNRELIKVSLIKTRGQGAFSEGTVAALAGGVAEIENAMRSLLPNLAHELALRGQVLRQNWESRGPGLLKHLAQITDARIPPQAAQIVVVHPAQGGGGGAHILYNLVRLEAVLTNARPEFPEIVRLAWLLSQLNLELPALNETLPANRLHRIGALAMIPPILAAAEHVELARHSAEACSEALEYWLPHAGDCATLGQTLWSWWQAYQAGQPSWAVALGALDKLLPAS